MYENNNKEALLIDERNSERKQKGSTKWNAYILYLRDGADIIFDTFILILIFGVRETTSAFYNWLLVESSDDENHRRRDHNNCTQKASQTINTVLSMNDTEWNEYRDSRFNIFCC